MTSPEWPVTRPDSSAHPQSRRIAAASKVRSNRATITHQAILNTLKLVPRFSTEEGPPAAQRFVYNTEYPRFTSRNIGPPRVPIRSVTPAPNPTALCGSIPAAGQRSWEHTLLLHAPRHSAEVFVIEPAQRRQFIVVHESLATRFRQQFQPVSLDPFFRFL